VKNLVNSAWRLPLRASIFNLKKQSTMKKFFAIAAIATVLVACGDAKTTEETKTVADTAAAAAAQTATEATNAADTGKAAVDTFKTVVDTLKK
jgi:hypothetical protein